MPTPTQAIAYLDRCFEDAAETRIDCRHCGKRVYADLFHTTEREVAGVRVSLICKRCSSPKNRTAIHQNPFRKWLKPTMASCLVECADGAAPALQRELEAAMLGARP
jgi:DNA-directed RNA polymerase subunit RPC12/RpoP